MVWRLSFLAAASVIAFATLAGAIEPRDKKSGFDFMSPENQSMQQDDLSNPGMLYIAEGERLWQVRDDPAGVACAGCHGQASQSMRGAMLRFPKIEKQSGALIDLQEQINLCRKTTQSLPAFAYESLELVALTAYVAHQSRGMVITPPTDATLDPYRRNGEVLYEQRLGQLGLSCAACHDKLWGQRLAGSIIPQSHPTAYPIYRLEWQTLGSLQRRLRNCMIGMRAAPYPYGAKELIELELYLLSRAQGLKIETPGVRP